MAAGVTDRLWYVADLVAAWEDSERKAEEAAPLMRLGDILAWLLVFLLAVGLFVVIPLIGWKMGEPLDRNGVKVLIIGITAAIKLIHSLCSSEKPK